jgi:FtsZ-interacting cell division protein ZipA
MTTRLQRINALREALVLAIVIISLVAAGLWVAREPADEDVLRISVSTLRSQAAELDLLLSQAENKLSGRFVQNHASQLANAVDEAREELDGQNVKPSLQGKRDRAKPLAAQFANAVHAFEAQPPSSASAPANADQIAHSLQAIEDSLKTR